MVKEKYQIVLDVEIQMYNQTTPITPEQALMTLLQMNIDGGVYVDVKSKQVFKKVLIDNTK